MRVASALQMLRCPFSGFSELLCQAPVSNPWRTTFDWHDIQIAAEDNLEGDRTRGAFTITQQLVKNLFFGTGRSMLRKGAEVTLVPVAEFVLGKQRILEIYRVVSTTKLQPAIPAGNRRHGPLQFCRLP